jgi:toxin ParE1/3/4
VAHSVVFAPEAEADLLALYDYIAADGGADRALHYVEWIVAACQSLATFPARGRRRDDIRPRLRVTSQGRRVTIAFHVAAETVTIDSVLAAGHDLGGAFEAP